ncbi:guanine nucleotide-binding protein subunit alpha-14 [Platysternon megacephalum]|uniref:Guanine nucleotide-binding protein subunit alpha-14 n=1 Tax=Platysternon megacephalum TaxID=55544 RepID=A0A4D9DI25_9SAUR|nr:guanine nucleotide-binding protein subunit alpha-14 [Platysternon megacephalum]
MPAGGGARCSRVEPPPASEAPPGHLNLKRSSACTNVSLLNLTGDDSESTDDGAGRGAAPLSPPLPSGDPAWSEDDTDPPTPLDMVNSGLVRAKDSVTSLKERASRVNRRVQSLQSECSMLCDNLERRRREAEDLEEYCTQLQESCHKVSQSVEDAEIKTNALKKSSVLLEELEQAALETHARAETLSSNLRLAQDEALRAKTYVERVRLSPQ